MLSMVGSWHEVEGSQVFDVLRPSCAGASIVDSDIDGNTWRDCGGEPIEILNAPHGPDWLPLWKSTLSAQH